LEQSCDLGPNLPERTPTHPLPALTGLARRLRRTEILKTIQGWIDKAKTWSATHAAKLTEYRDVLKPLLEAL
jgi:hypothetical protein